MTRGDQDVRWMGRQLLPMWKRIGGSLILAIVSGTLATLDPLLLRRLIDTELPHHNLVGCMLLVLTIVVCLLGSVGFLLLGMQWNFMVEQDLGQQLRIAILEQLNRLSAEFHENTPAGESMTRLGLDVDTISQFSAEVATSAVRAAVFFVVNLAVMLSLNAPMTAAILPSLFLFAWVQRRFSSSMSERADLAQNETGRANSMLYEYLSALPQIQLLCAEKFVVKMATSAWSGMVQARKSQKSTELLYAGAVNGALLFTTLLVLGLGSLQFLRGALTIGALVAFYTYQTRVFGPVSVMTDLYSRVKRVGASVHRVRGILESKSLVPDSGSIVKSRTTITQGISLDRVQFSYDGERIALQNLSLLIGTGECLAIVGPSGSGKSTLGRLLVRLSDPQVGEITLDGYALRDYSLAALRQTICYVPQRPVMFYGSIRENLLYAKPHATDSDLVRVAEVTHFKSVLDTLPAGLDTQLGPQGHTLSGGELQRLALTRALLRAAPVLVMDESTSALDVPTEQSILESIEAHCSSSILIVITHRLASIARMRRIIVLQQGQIAAAGNHNFLYENSPLYQRLYESSPVSIN